MTVTHQLVTELATLLTAVAALDETPHPRAVLTTPTPAVALMAENVLLGYGIECTAGTLSSGAGGLLLGTRTTPFVWPA